MSKKTIVMITGANRGIGLNFVRKYALRPDTTVIAGVRDLAGSSTQALDTVPTGDGSSILKVKLESVDVESPKRAVESLRREHDIAHIDVAIANAGISESYRDVKDTSVEAFRDHWEINTLGPVVLFQALLPLLEAAEQPKFVQLSTIFASIGDMEKYQAPCVAYGSSKAAADFIVRKIHFEHPNLISFVIHPGWVQTDQGNRGARFFGMEQAALTPDQSVDGMLDKIDKATREETSGSFQSYDGVGVPW